MIKKIILGFCFSLMCVTLCGCASNQANLAKKIESQVERLSSVISSVGEVKNSEVIISDVSAKYNKLSSKTESVSAPKGYEILYANCQKTLNCNDKIKSKKNEIKETSRMLKTLCERMKKNRMKVSDAQIKGCNECLSELTAVSNKITTTKLTVDKEVASIRKNIKNYKTNASVVSSKYTKLSNSLEDRLTYYENALSLLNQMKCLLTGTCKAPQSTATQDNTTNNNTTNNNTINDLVEKAKEIQNYVIDKNGTKHETYCDANGNCFTPKCDNNGNCYVCTQDGTCLPVKCKNGECYYPYYQQNNSCCYLNKNGEDFNATQNSTARDVANRNNIDNTQNNINKNNTNQNNTNQNNANQNNTKNNSFNNINNQTKNENKSSFNNLNNENRNRKNQNVNTINNKTASQNNNNNNNNNNNFNNNTNKIIRKNYYDENGNYITEAKPQILPKYKNNDNIKNISNEKNINKKKNTDTYKQKTFNSNIDSYGKKKVYNKTDFATEDKKTGNYAVFSEKTRPNTEIKPKDFQNKIKGNNI